MKIGYVCSWNAFASDGVTSKIASHTATWREAGHEVEIFCVSPAPPLVQAPSPPGPPGLQGKLFLFRNLRERARATVRLSRGVTAYNPDVVYVRYDIFVPPLRGLLRRFLTVVEVNTDTRKEFKLTRSRRQRSYDVYNRRVMFGGAGGIVCNTHELALSVAKFGRPTAVVSNGADLDACPPPVTTAPEGRPTLVFLAGASSLAWHGVDKVLFLAEATPEFDFELLGVDRRVLDDRNPTNVRIHEPMSRRKYSAILHAADAGLGTLAVHRKGLNEDSPLKVREYLAHGLPVVIGYEDTDFIGSDPWFLLRLPNCESNVRDHVDTIRTFVEAVRGRRVQRDEVGSLIGLEAKETARLAFFAELAGRESEGAEAAYRA